jgi:hypothetical protein
LDPDVAFVLAVADIGDVVADETDETNNDLNFVGVYHRPASPAPLVVRGRDDADDAITLTGGMAVVITGNLAAEPFVVAAENVSTIRVLSAGGDDMLFADALSASLLNVDQGTGEDTIAMVGDGVLWDLTGMEGPALANVDIVDVCGDGANHLILDAQTIQEMAESGSLRVRADDGDIVGFGGGWTLGDPQFVGDEFFKTLEQTGVSLLLSGPRPWQNPLNPYDVDGNRGVSPQDALDLINDINREKSRTLPTPVLAGPVPPLWLDVNGDQMFAPLDVLMVINYINIEAAAEAEAEAPWLPPAVLDSIDELRRVWAAAVPSWRAAAMPAHQTSFFGAASRPGDSRQLSAFSNAA